MGEKYLSYASEEQLVVVNQGFYCYFVSRVFKVPNFRTKTILFIRTNHRHHQ